MLSVPLGALLLLLSAGCGRPQGSAVVQPQFYPVTAALDRPETGGTAATVAATIQPYSAQLTILMDSTVGEIAVALTKGQPESSMGNWTADLIAEAAADVFPGRDIAFAVQNYGGIRIAEVPAGPLRLGTIYELMPFDNELVLVEVDGRTLTDFVTHMLRDGGWPVSAALAAELRGDETEIHLDGAAVDPVATYYLAVPDYVANGGSDAAMLVGKQQIPSGRMIRDLLIEYASRATGPVDVRVEGKRMKISDR